MAHHSAWRLALTIVVPVLLGGCQIEANAPMRAFDIKYVSETGVPVTVNAVLTARFPTES